MSNYYYQKAIEQMKPIMFSDLIKQDLENKKPYASKWPFTCRKCGKRRESEDDVYFYGREKVCSFCHEEAIDWLKYVIF